MRTRLILSAVATAAVVAVPVTMLQASSSPSARTQHIVGFTNNPENNGIGDLTALGPISGHGRDVVVNDTTDRFVFANGAITVVHHKTHDHSSQDPSTCVFQYDEQGSYTVTGGSGAYSHARGSGTYALEVLGQGCHDNEPPSAFALTLHASGPLTI